MARPLFFPMRFCIDPDSIETSGHEIQRGEIAIATGTALPVWLFLLASYFFSNCVRFLRKSRPLRTVG
jgi:hypothetical protein